MFASGLVLRSRVVSLQHSWVAVTSPDMKVCIVVGWFLSVVVSFAQTDDQLPVVNDREILRQIPLEIGRLVEEKKVLAWDQLVEQMKRTRAQVDLPVVARKNAEHLYRQCVDGVVAIASVYKCDRCTKWHSGGAATAWVLTEDGVMVTNYHVFDGEKRAGFAVRTRDGRFAPVVEILAASEQDDIAVFRVAGGGFVPIPLGGDAEVGDDIHVIAHPDSRFFTYTAGKVSRYFVKRGHGNKRAVVMGVTAEFARGSSGGPVLDACGHVVGMVASTNSIYYPSEKNTERRGPFQMVIRNCVPARAIRSLITKK